MSQLADPGRTPFEDAKISTHQDSPESAPSTVDSHTSERPQGTPDVRPKLAASRAYTLSLSPYFLYTRSELISILISSKVYRQLEFMAVGSWWIHSPEHPNAESLELGATRLFHRVPGNREDVFADSNISMKSKRTLMRFLRHISKPQDEEEQGEAEGEEDLSMPFADYLSSNFSVPQDLQNPLLSLSLSQLLQQDTSASYAVPRIKRHLASIGALGPGFGAVVSKYGGGSEILQVGCRASAVGGAVYALDTGVQSITDGEVSAESDHPVEVCLSNGETVRTRVLIGSAWDLPSLEQPSCTRVARSITIASSTFTSLFPVTAEGAPVPASTVLMFPGDTLDSPQSPPVYLQVHSSDTGDCPRQQSKSIRSHPLLTLFPSARMMIILYLSTLPDRFDEPNLSIPDHEHQPSIVILLASFQIHVLMRVITGIIYGSVALSGPEGHSLLERAVDRLLQAEGPQAIALWCMRYNQLGRLSNGGTPPTIQTRSPHVFNFPPPSLDLAFEDETVDMIKQAWVNIVGDGVAHDEFMIFEDREGTSDD